jgi:hypothetical protein
MCTVKWVMGQLLAQGAVQEKANVCAVQWSRVCSEISSGRSLKFYGVVSFSFWSKSARFLAETFFISNILSS